MHTKLFFDHPREMGNESRTLGIIRNVSYFLQIRGRVRLCGPAPFQLENYCDWIVAFDQLQSYVRLLECGSVKRRDREPASASETRPQAIDFRVALSNRSRQFGTTRPTQYLVKSLLKNVDFHEKSEMEISISIGYISFLDR